MKEFFLDSRGKGLGLIALLETVAVGLLAGRGWQSPSGLLRAWALRSSRCRALRTNWGFEKVSRRCLEMNLSSGSFWGGWASAVAPNSDPRSSASGAGGARWPWLPRP